MQKRTLFQILLYSAAVMLISNTAISKTQFNSLLVDHHWLKFNITQTNILIIDVRSKIKYERGHIHSAINIPAEESFGKLKNINRIASPNKIKILLSKYGVKNNKHIILYDNGDLLDASHFFWVLEAYGHKQLSILNGGIKIWRKNHLAISQKTTKIKPSNYIPAISHKYITTKLSTRLAINSDNITILDARIHSEYIGNRSEARRRGHIPDAINIPWHHNTQTKAGIRILKSRSKLRKLYQTIPKSNKVIAYCNRGKQSALSYFSLRLLGYKVSIYDGAWLEWGNDKSLPIEN